MKTKGDRLGKPAERLRYWATQISHPNLRRYGSQVISDLLVAADLLERNAESNTPMEASGLSPEAFTVECGFTRQTLYNVPREYWPAHIRIGRRIVITERPADWLARMAKLGGVPTKNTHPSKNP